MRRFFTLPLCTPNTYATDTKTMHSHFFGVRIIMGRLPSAATAPAASAGAGAAGAGAQGAGDGVDHAGEGVAEAG